MVGGVGGGGVTPPPWWGQLCWGSESPIKNRPVVPWTCPECRPKEFQHSHFSGLLFHLCGISPLWPEWLSTGWSLQMLGASSFCVGITFLLRVCVRCWFWCFAVYACHRNIRRWRIFFGAGGCATVLTADVNMRSCLNVFCEQLEEFQWVSGQYAVLPRVFGPDPAAHL